MCVWGTTPACGPCAQLLFSGLDEEANAGAGAAVGRSLAFAGVLMLMAVVVGTLLSSALVLGVSCARGEGGSCGVVRAG